MSGSPIVEETEDAIIVHNNDQVEQPSIEVEDVGSVEEPGQELRKTPQTEMEENNEANVVPSEDYQPNFNYRVMDDEKEFPEDLRSFVTTKESEERFRDLLTKADSVDHWKDKVSKVEGQYGEAQQNNEGLTKFVQSVQNLAQNDVSTLMQVLKVPPEKVMDYALQYADAQSDPQQLQRFDQDQQMRAQNFAQQQQLEMFQAQQSTQVKQDFSNRMNSAMSQPEIAQFRQEYDSRMGNGEFEKAVRNYGTELYNASGGQTLLPPEQAVNDVYSKYKNLIPIGQGNQGQQHQQPASAQPPITPIPRVGTGQNVSPSRKRAMSIKDIEADYQQRFGNNR